ncbi:hypothetical protein FDJ58_gp118 [Bacillus phage SIOphi]|uniref:Uncharacterized protein n=1 Tax=Bacillus phage SIOphi TaxID=1285382 RepID=R4JGM6_9CAUD|nr:hypothetical protein FDJ58_gp118 [Bacillus phage SIOphi]AGK86926.1 hypothetical protein SIOphi_00590 [Bacillus phage SIOphi]
MGYNVSVEDIKESIEFSIDFKETLLQGYKDTEEELIDALAASLGTKDKDALEKRQGKFRYLQIIHVLILKIEKEIQMLQDLLRRINNGEAISYAEYSAILYGCSLTTGGKYNV